MSEEAPPKPEEGTAAEEGYVTFNVKSSTDARFVLTLPPTTTIAELKEKLATSEYANIPAESQRLIYSGRVLKDTDSLASHKVKDGNTIHLVKRAASNQRQNPANQGGSPAVATGDQPGQVPSNIAAGTGNDILAGLTGARYAGHAQLPGAGMFGPDGGMGAPPGPEAMADMLNDPAQAAALSEALQNPQVIDMMISSNPMLRNMPNAREMLQSPMIRQMLSNPESLRSMLQMSRSMGLGNLGGANVPAFPAPGNANPSRNANRTNPEGTGARAANPTGPAQSPPPVDLASMMAAMQGQQAPPGGANPFATLFGQPPVGGTGAGSPPAGSTPAGNGQANPFAALFPPPGGATAAPDPFAALAQNPQIARQVLEMMGAGAGANPFAMMGGTPSTSPPDNRPPEERYESQLRQLNDMGFFDFDANIAALRRSGGSVQGAIEHLLAGGH
ncbi:MAG: Ubiquilin-4 [Vezdaea acicularis]|nr:MAG: Ubiquilin-4 [Vezdaea acicularis]